LYIPDEIIGRSAFSRIKFKSQWIRFGNCSKTWRDAMFNSDLCNCSSQSCYV